LQFQHGLESFSPEGFVARMLANRDSAAVPMKVEAMRTGLAIQHKAIPDQRGNEFARGEAV